MNRERLQRLIEILDEVEKSGKRFDMTTWCTKDACGTAACAAGWYTLLAPEQGLVIRGVRDEDCGEVFYHIRPVSNPDRDWPTTELLMEHFDLSRTEVFYIFFGCDYRVKWQEGYEDITPAQVKEHIHDILNGTKKPIDGSRI